MWVADSDRQEDLRLQPFPRRPGTPARTSTTSTFPNNDNPAGIWSDGTTMWVADSTQTQKIYAYRLSTTKARDTGKDFNTLDAASNNDNPAGIWSDGDHDVGRRFQVDKKALRLHRFHEGPGHRQGLRPASTFRITHQPRRHLVRRHHHVGRGLRLTGSDLRLPDLSDQGNTTAAAKTSTPSTAVRERQPTPASGPTATTMWVADTSEDKIYSYNMPAQSADATLSAHHRQPQGHHRL